MKLTGEFWETIGPHYVYGYKHPDGSWKYIGKAVGNRVTHHVAEKGYDLEDAYILARNLTSDKIAAAVESVFINEYQPTDNIVSGHHKENYIMASLKGLFDEHLDSQRNYHFDKAEFLLKYREELGNTIGGTASTGSSFSVWSNFRESTQFVISSGKDTQCQLKVQPPGNTEAHKKLFGTIRDRVVPALEGEYELDISEKAVGGVITWTVEDEDTAIALWSDFTS